MKRGRLTVRLLATLVVILAIALAGCGGSGPSKPGIPHPVYGSCSTTKAGAVAKLYSSPRPVVRRMERRAKRHHYSSIREMFKAEYLACVRYEVNH